MTHDAAEWFVRHPGISACGYSDELPVYFPGSVRRAERIVELVKDAEHLVLLLAEQSSVPHGDYAG